MDREGEIAALFRARQAEGGAEQLVCARHDRALGDDETLFAAIRGGPAQGAHELQVDRASARRGAPGQKSFAGREARRAATELRWRDVVLPAQRKKRRRLGAEPIRLNAVHVLEPSPSKGAERIEWLLLSTLPVRGQDEAETVLGFSSLRGRIEDWHRILKSGCDVEEMAHSRTERIKRAVTLNAVIAWRLAALTLVGRHAPELDTGKVFSHSELAMLMDFAGELGLDLASPEQATGLPDLAAVSLGEALLLVARLGGYLNRKHDAPPGHQVVWDGYMRMATGAQTMERIVKRGDESALHASSVKRTNDSWAGRGPQDEAFSVQIVTKGGEFGWKQVVWRLTRSASSNRRIPVESTMSMRHSTPAGHWSWPIPVNHSQGVRAGDLLVTGSQKVLDPAGRVLHKGDLTRQLEASLDQVEAVLTDLGADLEDVVKLVIYYVNSGEVDECSVLKRTRQRFKGDMPPAVMPVPLPRLAYPGQMAEIEAIAMRGEDGARLERRICNPATLPDTPFSHGVWCGDMIFVGAQSPLDRNGVAIAPGEPVEQAKINIENIRTVLMELGAAFDDACNINTFYVGHGTADDWARAGAIRGNAFPAPGPCGTGVPVPTLITEGLTIRQEVFAVRGFDGEKLKRRASRPVGHWDWPIPMTTSQGLRVGNRIFVGGQVALNSAAETLQPDDLASQTSLVLDFIGDVLTDLGARLDDVVRVKGYHVGGEHAERLHETLSVSNRYFPSAGPASSDVPLEKLGIEGLMLEMDAWAVVA